MGSVLFVGGVTWLKLGGRASKRKQDGKKGWKTHLGHFDIKLRRQNRAIRLKKNHFVNVYYQSFSDLHVLSSCI